MAGRLDIHAPANGSIEPSPELADGDELPILAVDDRADNLIALEAVLEPLGMPVVRAGSGEEALRLLLERDFSLILLDVRMPGLDGLETARLIKSRDRTREVPIVFLTATREDMGEIVRGYGLGAVDYVVKPFDPEVLRSKVAVFAQLEKSRRRLRRSEAFLREAFDAAPVGKTMLDADSRIVRANRTFGRVVGHTPEALTGRSILEFCHPEDHDQLRAVLMRTAQARAVKPSGADRLDPDIRLLSADKEAIWVSPAASVIEPTQLGADLLLLQWVDVTARRRAEEARADLLIEQAAREHAEAQAERLEKLRRLVEPVDAAGLDELLGELARRLTEAFDADAAEVEVERESEDGAAARSVGAHVQRRDAADASADDDWKEIPLVIDEEPLGKLRVLPNERFGLRQSAQELLRDAADRISLMIRRAQLHEQERHIARELQRGLLPARPPQLSGVRIAAKFEAAGSGAEVGGDWYDCFRLPDGRLGVVIGDVTGNGIQAASTMGQVRSVMRAFAFGDPNPPTPAQVIARVQRYHQMAGLKELLTALYLILDPASGRLVWANAGHPPPLLRTSDGDVQPLSGADRMVCRIDAAYLDREAVMGDGDMLFVYTDGLIERRGESIDAGVERLAAAIRTGPDDPEELCARLLAAPRPPEASAGDDVTALAVKLTPTASERGAPHENGDSGQRVQITLSREVSTPSNARRLLERSFGDALDHAELERAKVAVSELATNAVRHGQGEITVVAELASECLLVEVADQGPGFQHPIREAPLDGPGGWGFKVVDAETTRWGIRDGTACVWFEIERSGR